jgi:hypothetical protein
MRKVTRTVIEGETPVLYHLDGEPKPAAARLEVVVQPAVLRIAAP